jgi:hypothetical protein
MIKVSTLLMTLLTLSSVSLFAGPDGWRRDPRTGEFTRIASSSSNTVDFERFSPVDKESGNPVKNLHNASTREMAPRMLTRTPHDQQRNSRGHSADGVWPDGVPGREIGRVSGLEGSWRKENTDTGAKVQMNNTLFNLRSSIDGSTTDGKVFVGDDGRQYVRERGQVTSVNTRVAAKIVEEHFRQVNIAPNSSDHGDCNEKLKR